MFCCKDMKGYDHFWILFKMLGVVAFAFFIITIWPAAMTWVNSVNPWYFLIAAIIFKALYHIKALKKEKVVKKKK